MQNVKYDQNGKLVLLAEAKGYVMCRHPGCMPFVLSCKEWHALSDVPL